MPLFAILARDKPDHLDLRMATRESHLMHLRSLGDRLIAAGPTLDADGRPNGSLVVIAADDRQAAEAFAEADPYSKAGLFAVADVRPWNALLGTWVESDDDGDDARDEEE